MYGKFQDFLKAEIQSIKDAGLYKTERLIATPQDAEIKLTTGETVLNFCANNYLGLSSHPRVIEGAKKALDARGIRHVVCSFHLRYPGYSQRAGS